MNVTKDSNRFVGVFEIALECVAGIEYLCLAMPTGEKKQRVAVIFLDLFTELLVRLPTQPPVPENIFDKEIQIILDRFPGRYLLVVWM